MAKIVSIETATKVCSVAFHENDRIVASQTYYLDKSHSTLLPAIIKEMLKNCEVELEQIDAFAVSSGPGSYTGLRIGTTTAKGLAFALSKPLIAVPTLDAMLLKVGSSLLNPGYFCPMIDARRMEVYCLLADESNLIWDMRPQIVDSGTFKEFTDKPLYVFGDGAEKTKEVLEQSNIRWLSGVHPSAEEVGRIAFQKFQNKEFEDVAYFEPVYLKEFHTKPAKKLI